MVKENFKKGFQFFIFQFSKCPLKLSEIPTSHYGDSEGLSNATN